MKIEGSVGTLSKPQPFWKGQTFWFVMALAVLYGGFYNYLPVGFPAFKQVFAVDLEQLGRSQFLFAVGSLVFCVAGGWILHHLDLGWGAVLSQVALVASLLLIGAAPSFTMVLVGGTLLGVAIIATYIVICSIISDCYPEQRQSLFFVEGVVESIGATAGPAALGWWLTHADHTGGSWRTGYLASSALAMVLVIWGLWLRRRIKSGPAPATETQTSALGIMGDILTKPTIYAVGLLMLLHGIAQGGMVSWVGQLYQKRLAIDAASAALFISLNSAGFFAGRSMLVWITARHKIHELVILAFCSVATTLAFVTTIVSPSYLGGLIMFTLAGALVSGNGPSISSYTGMRFVGRSATAFALMNGLGSVGAAVGPYVIGILGQKFGLEKAIWLMPVFSLLLAAYAFAWFIKERARR